MAAWLRSDNMLFGSFVQVHDDQEIFNSEDVTQTMRYITMLSIGSRTRFNTRQRIFYHVLGYLSTVVYPRMRASLADIRLRPKHLELEDALYVRIIRVRNAFDLIIGQEKSTDLLPEQKAAARKSQRQLDDILQAIRGRRWESFWSNEW